MKRSILYIIAISLFTYVISAYALQSNRPVIVIENSNLQIGKILEGEKKEKGLFIANDGEENLIITKIKTSCSCLTAVPTKLTIKPGEKKEIAITFNSTGKSPGLHTHTITIFSNDPAHSTSLITVNSNIIANIPSMTSEELYGMIKNKENIVILDVREKNEYKEKHIKNAIWLPKGKFDKEDEKTEKKIEKIDKDAIVAVYCGGGHRSSYVARKLRERGYNAFNLEGISLWSKKDYPLVRGPKLPQSLIPAAIGLEEAYEHYFLMFGKSVVWIDVRDAEKYNEGHIKGALSIPLSKFEENIASMPRDKDIVLYCEGYENGKKCEAATSAGKILLKNGYRHGKIRVFEDGYYAWTKKRLPVEIVKNKE